LTTAFFAAVVMMQWVNVIVCKTRHSSIFNHGMKNWVLDIALLLEFPLAAILMYTPGFNFLKILRAAFAPVDPKSVKRC